MSARMETSTSRTQTLLLTLTLLIHLVITLDVKQYSKYCNKILCQTKEIIEVNAFSRQSEVKTYQKYLIITSRFLFRKLGGIGPIANKCSVISEVGDRSLYIVIVSIYSIYLLVLSVWEAIREVNSLNVGNIHKWQQPFAPPPHIEHQCGN